MVITVNSRGHSQKLPQHSSERGQAIILLTLLIMGLLGIMALAVDGGILYAARRSMQNAADNAALAGALAICQDGDVVAAAQNSALLNSGAILDITINQPPLSGENVGDNTYIEVILSAVSEANFIQLVYDGPLQTSARAVGHCFQGDGPVGGGNVLIVLDENDSCAFSAEGNATIYLNLGGGGIYTNSSHANAMCASGNADVFADTGAFVVGGWDTSGNANFDPEPVTGVSPMADPLADLAAPTNPGGSCVPYSLSGGSDTIDPGLYCSITISGDAVLTMNPGIYYIEGGNFDASGSAGVDAAEVLIYMDDGNFSLTGNGVFDITAPTSGPYQGLMVFMDQSNVGSITISGNGVFNTTGTIYGAQAHLDLSGNGASMVLNAQVIVGTFDVSGNASMTITYDANLVFGGPGGADFIELAE